MKSNDILLVGRPDHSLLIYKKLAQQRILNYTYITFKALPLYLRNFFHNKKIVFLDGNYTISYWATFVNFLKYKLNLKILSNYSEDRSLDKCVKHSLSSNYYKIIHYWPEYTHTPIEEVSKSTFTIADVHMPFALAVLEEMKPIYEKYNINYRNSFLKKAAIGTFRELISATNVLVPSLYVADTLKTVFPNKNYYVVSYGITISADYKKKGAGMIKKFAYAGTISLEKGCDLLCDFFASHNEFELHLFGNISNSQIFIFEKYKNLRNIIFHGSVPKSLLQSKLLACDVGIHLSRFDAYSLAVGEMIGSGLPVIVSNKTGNADDITKYNLGLVTNLDMESISRAIKDITSESRYDEICNSIDYYITNIHQDYGSKMISFYNEILRNNG